MNQALIEPLLRLYARALKGKRARGKKTQKRGKNISIISALSLQKVLASINIYGSVDGVTEEDQKNRGGQSRPLL